MSGRDDGVRSSLLDLLLAEASASAFEEVVHQARHDGATDVEVGRLEHELAKALRVRAAIEERRARESELAALYETAGDLSSLRDLEKVLRAIVRRARTLLGSDAAYLTLIDESRQDTYMRVTDGIKSDAFRRVRLHLGAGLVAWSPRPPGRTPPRTTSATNGSRTPWTTWWRPRDWWPFWAFRSNSAAA